MRRPLVNFGPFLAAFLLCGAVFTLASRPRVPPVPPSKAQNDEPRAVAFVNPYDSPQQFMEGIYAADRTIYSPQGYRIRAVIVPHHLIASASIASAMKMLEHQRFSKVLLLSPDHFDRCPTILCTVNSDYDTPFGRVRADAGTVRTLLSSPLVTPDADLFRQEHGIHAVLPFVAHYAPDAAVTPLVFSQRLPWRSDRQDVLELLGRAVDDDTVLIVSSDFSHYLSLTDAEDKDEKTAKALFAKDFDGIAALANPDQSDCPNCLWALASLADVGGYYNPSVILHTNSATILDDRRISSTTSHFSMVWYENAKLSQDDLAVAGDVTFTRGMRSLSDAAERWWEGSGPRFANLEGPLAESCSSSKNPYIFCNPYGQWPDVQDLATHWGTMNNHMLDLGATGKTATETLIRKSGKVPVTDKPWEDERLRLFALTAVMNPVTDAAAANLAGTQASVLRLLGEERPGKLTVVLVHAGEEYHALTGDVEEDYYERLIDAGADAVVVSHSHVPGDMRIYKGKPIFRGMGNFVFDQPDSVATSTAKLVRLAKTDGRILFETAVFHR